MGLWILRRKMNTRKRYIALIAVLFLMTLVLVHYSNQLTKSQNMPKTAVARSGPEKPGSPISESEKSNLLAGVRTNQTSNNTVAMTKAVAPTTAKPTNHANRTSNLTDAMKKAVAPTKAKPTNRPLQCRGCFFSDFPSLLSNPRICANVSGRPPEMVMMITSSPDAFDRRRAIRDTWVTATRNNTAHVRHVFLLGTTPDAAVMEAIRAESANHSDVLLSDFVDAYSNLTYKTMVGLHWIVRHCGHARFFLKTDHDMYISVERILGLARQMEKTIQTSIMGSCPAVAIPFRKPKTKYYASIRSYPQPTYPGFCSGTGYISSLALARKLVATSPDIPFFHLEDVYLALVVRHLGYKLTEAKGFGVGASVCQGAGRDRDIKTIHQVKPDLMRQLWVKKCTL